MTGYCVIFVNIFTVLELWGKLASRFYLNGSLHRYLFEASVTLYPLKFFLPMADSLFTHLTE